MNIVFGGSFNPITKAHEKIVDKILNEFEVENFIFLPVGNMYCRKNTQNQDMRVKMIELIFSNNPKIKISLNEINRTKYEGTYVSLKELSQEYSDIYFVLGADNLLDLKTWINYDKLISEFKFIVFNRNNVSLEQTILKQYKAYKEHFILVDFHENVSSSPIRDNFKKNKNLLNPKVYEYILKNNLYEVNENV